MSEDWQVTAQMFTSLFEKPKMSEKLLNKPPFKYLFDIITQTTKSTGFGKGLYSEEELSADFYESKERKIYYLKKIITLVGAMLKEDIEAKPNKIVAGVEADKTNLFLQAMYRAAVSGQDSSAVVKKVLNSLAQEEADMGFAKRPEPKEEAPPKKKEEPKKQEKPAEKPKREEVKEPEPERPPASKQQRPVSRSGPPKDRSNVQVVEDQKKKEGPSGIIREDVQKKKDDDENFFETKQADVGRGINKDDGAVHGKMVTGVINEMKAESEKVDDQPQSKGIKIVKRDKAKKTVEGKTEISKPIGGGETEGTASQSEVEVIQKLIQSLTQNINPLKKSIDFVTDDIESMNKEMDHWRSQYLASKAKHQLELANTEEQLQPLQNKLAELEEQIKDKKFKIQAAKSHILQNETKIQQLLYSVVANK